MRHLRPPGEWRSLFAEPRGAFSPRLHEIYGQDPGEIQRRLPLWTDALDGFARNFSPHARVFIARAPGRVNLLGMHIELHHLRRDLLRLMPRGWPLPHMSTRRGRLR